MAACESSEAASAVMHSILKEDVMLDLGTEVRHGCGAEEGVAEEWVREGAAAKLRLPLICRPLQSQQQRKKYKRG